MSQDVVLVKGLASVAAVLPRMLGYHVRESAVLVCLGGKDSTRVQGVMRADLPAPNETGDLALVTSRWLRRNGSAAALLLGFEDAAFSSVPALRALRAVCEARGVEVAGIGRVCDGLVFDLSGEDEEFAGRVDPADPAGAPFVALGRGVLASREAVADSFRPGTDAAAAAVRECWEAITSGGVPVGEGDTIRAGMYGWARLVEVGPEAVPVEDLPLSDVVAAMRLVTVAPVRDLVMTMLCPGILPEQDWNPAMLSARAEAGDVVPVVDWSQRDTLGAVEARLRQVCRLAPAAAASDVLTVAGHVAWCCGDGAAASSAFELAMEADPAHSLAGLLSRAVAMGMRPPVMAGGRD